MKQRVIGWMLVIGLAVAMLGVAAADEPTAAGSEGSVTLRVEGISENLYYGTIPVGEDGVNALEFSKAIDEAEESLQITGLEFGYVESVNGEYAGTFGGWDGWLYRINGIEPSVGLGDYSLKAGDSLVLYYGDPYGVGMQYPELSYADGVLTVTSEDTTYDENWNPVVTTNPVAGAAVWWDGTEYVTDANGTVLLDAAQCVAGAHRVQITKVDANGIPLVLRLAPDATFVIEEEAVSPTPSEETPASTDEAPQTADGSYVWLASFAVCANIAALVLICRKKERYEENA